MTRRAGLLDRATLAVLVVAAVVLVGRGLLVSRAHGERIDDVHHLFQGLGGLTGRGVSVNDPPLGKQVMTAPLHLAGAHRPRTYADVYGNPFSRQRTFEVVAAWHSLLFAPVVALAFAWARRLYGTAAGALAAGLLLTEPTLAAFLPVPYVDGLGVAAILAAAYASWRYVEAPTPRRMLVAAGAIGAALLVKHTALVAPAAFVALAAFSWWVHPWWTRRRTDETAEDAAAGRSGDDARPPPKRALRVAGVLVLVPVVLFLLTGARLERVRFPPGDVRGASALGRVVSAAPALPAPDYVRALVGGLAHLEDGHTGFLWGETSQTGWRHYFPVLATYKVPLGTWLVLLLGAASFVVVRPRREEASLLVPLAVWGSALVLAKVNIGFRHALPVVAFALLLAARALTVPRPAWRVAAWAGLAASVLHVAAFHPDYVAYVNWPRTKVARSINDSNLDAGQALPQVRAWIEAHPGRPIHLAYFGPPLVDLEALGPDVHVLTRFPQPSSRLAGRLPTQGVLIISPYMEAGIVGDPDRVFSALDPVVPHELIGHCLHVYDLDRLRAEGFRWETPAE